jgi:hypothetical protein
MANLLWKETPDRVASIDYPSASGALGGSIRVWDGGRTRRHLPGKGLINHIVDKRLLGAEKIPGGTAHDQEHRQQHGVERASDHGTFSDKTERLATGTW